MRMHSMYEDYFNDIYYYHYIIYIQIRIMISLKFESSQFA